MILMIDNYDSFTYNLVQYLGELGCEVVVHRNDQVTLAEIERLAPDQIIISPGPGEPNDAGISLELIKHFCQNTPILGVCLGHQSIGQATGSIIVPAHRLMHGKTDDIYHDDTGLFAGLPNPFVATRYHSLVIQPDSLNEEFEMNAWCQEPDGSQVIMGIHHRDYPLIGFQFHPESFLTEVGPELLRRFLAVRGE